MNAKLFCESSDFHKFLSCILAGLMLSGTAHSATINVDGRTCSLADAITAANTDAIAGGCTAGAGTDTLQLCARLYTLRKVDNDTDGPNGLPSVISRIAIEGDPDGDGRGATIRRAKAPETPLFRLFHIAQRGWLSLNRLTLRDGATKNAGGAIFNAGSLVLQHNKILDNACIHIQFGPAQNRTQCEFGGAGLFNQSTGTVLLKSTVFSGNSAGYHGSGGGFYNAGSIRFIAGAISDNRATGGTGGGLYNKGTLAMTEVAVSNNRTAPLCCSRQGSKGGGISNDGAMSITNAIVSGNISEGSVAGWMSGDTAGGGLLNSGTLTVTNSTISGNTASGDHTDGSSISNSGSLTLTNSTVKGCMPLEYNCGDPAIHAIVNSGGATLVNTLVVASPGCFGSVQFLGLNLVSDASCGALEQGQLTGDPGLRSLLDNGGPTLTHALSHGSIAVDVGPDEIFSPFDQRRIARPRGVHPDIGAYELVRAIAPAFKPIIEFFDRSVASGRLIGAGNNSELLEATRNQLLVAGLYNHWRLQDKTCAQLYTTSHRIDTDGKPDVNDYVTGQAAPSLMARIHLLRKDRGCR